MVQVTQREEGRPALLSEVRAQVQELLLQEQRLAKKQQVLSRLRAVSGSHRDPFAHAAAAGDANEHALIPIDDSQTFRSSHQA